MRDNELHSRLSLICRLVSCLTSRVFFPCVWIWHGLHRVDVLYPAGNTILSWNMIIYYFSKYSMAGQADGEAIIRNAANHAFYTLKVWNLCGVFSLPTQCLFAILLRNLKLIPVIYLIWHASNVSGRCSHLFFLLNISCCILWPRLNCMNLKCKCWDCKDYLYRCQWKALMYAAGNVQFAVENTVLI